MQVARQMGHSRIETTKNIYGHLFAQDQAAILDTLNRAVSRLYIYESQDLREPGERARPPETPRSAGWPYSL
jgi:hypothetical protein